MCHSYTYCRSFPSRYPVTLPHNVPFANFCFCTLYWKPNCIHGLATPCIFFYQYLVSHFCHSLWMCSLNRLRHLVLLVGETKFRRHICVCVCVRSRARRRPRPRDRTPTSSVECTEREKQAMVVSAPLPMCSYVFHLTKAVVKR
jgi:hypothetical protein